MQNSCGPHWTRRHSENRGRPQQPCVTTGAKCKTSRDSRTIPSLCWLSTSFSFNTDSNYWELVSSGLGLWDRQVSHKSMVKRRPPGERSLRFGANKCWPTEGRRIDDQVQIPAVFSPLENTTIQDSFAIFFLQADISTPCSYFWLHNFASCVPHVQRTGFLCTSIFFPPATHKGVGVHICVRHMCEHSPTLTFLGCQWLGLCASNHKTGWDTTRKSVPSAKLSQSCAVSRDLDHKSLSLTTCYWFKGHADKENGINKAISHHSITSFI